MSNSELRVAMFRHGVKARDIAKACNLSRAAIYAKFSGRVNWSLDEAQKVREVCGLSDGETIQIFFGSE